MSGRESWCYIATLAVALGLAGEAVAAGVTGPEFHRALFALQQQVVSSRPIRSVEETGQYEGAAAARYRYRDTRYYDAENGRLLARVRRDAELAEAIHIVEVNIFDAEGRLIRDFGSVALPWAPRIPVRTFINLHHYNGALHSFRQYDIDGNVAYESCEGVLAGQKVHIALDAVDRGPATAALPEYKACFDGMAANWRDYLAPH